MPRPTPKPISFVPNIVTYTDIVTEFKKICKNTQFIKNITGNTIQKMNLNTNHDSKKIGKIKSLEYKHNKSINISYYTDNKKFYKSYMFDTENLTIEEISNILKKYIIEVDNHIYAAQLSTICEFITPQIYSFYINIEPSDDSFIIQFIIIMEYIDIEHDTVEFNKNNDGKLKELREINECLQHHSLTHNDLALRNIRIMKKSKKILIYDWGESFISKLNHGLENNKHNPII
jgi:hypothetical protein